MKYQHFVFSFPNFFLKIKPKDWDSSGGASDWLGYILALVNNNPTKNFYYISGSDFNTLTEKQQKTLFPYGNIKFFDKPDEEVPMGGTYTYILDYFKQNKIKSEETYGFMQLGLQRQYCIPYFVPEMACNNYIEHLYKVDDYAIYLSSTFHFLNESKIGWAAICLDSRVLLHQKDLENRPEYVFGLLNHSYKTKFYSRKHCRYATTIVEQKYFEIESSILVGLQKEDINSLIKSKKKDFGIVCNWSSVVDRYKIVKNVIGNNNYEVFGTWPVNLVKDDKRFKNPLPRFELHKKIREWRFSYCIPVEHGSATTKYLEYIANGVYPIFYTTYDEQRNIVHKDFPRAIVVDIQKDNRYIELIKPLYEFYMAPEYTSGKKINLRMMQLLDKDYIDTSPDVNTGLWKKFK